MQFEKQMAKMAGLMLSLGLVAVSTVPAALSPEEMYEQVAPSVLTLEVENNRKEKFVGTAFLSLRPGLAVTAWHVIHDAAKIEARFPNHQPVKVLGLVAKDESRDLALLEIEPLDRPLLPIAPTPPRIGGKIFIIGAPQGLDFSLADGLISQIREVDGVAHYQLSCPISPGNSGGPVVNDRGEVLGVVSWRKRNAQNLGFAIPGLELARLEHSATAAPLAVGNFGDRQFAQREPVSVLRPQVESESGLTEFRRLWTAHAGKPITVTLDDGEATRKFIFEVPHESEPLENKKRESVLSALPVH